MKKILFLLTSIISISICWADKTSNSMPAVVSGYYNNMMRLRQSDANGRAFLQRAMNEAFAGGADGNLLPNDLKVCGVSAVDCNIQSIGDPALKPSIYTTALRNLADDMLVQVDYRYGKTEYLAGGVEYQKGEDTPRFARSVVKKTYTFKNKPYVFVDTIMFSIETNAISYIHNNCVPLMTGAQNTSSSDISTLSAQASELYYSKRYKEAFELYHRILVLDKNNQNANYSIALLYYRNKGCEHLRLKSKERDTRAWNHMVNAQFGYDYAMGKRAIRILKNWTRGGGGM